MNRIWLLLLIVVSVQAQAFPVILGGAGALALGAGFLPLLGIGLALYFGIKLWRLPRQVLVLWTLAGFFICAIVSIQWAGANREAILANTQSLGAPSKRTTDIPYPYVSDTAQAASAARITAEDFYQGLSNREIRVIRVDLEPQLFKDFGFGATATQIHDNPDPLVGIAKKGNRQVVLVDERGTTAAAIAEDLSKKYGVRIQFLEGGANALNDYAWDHLAKVADDHAVLPADIPSFKQQRKPTVISTTNTDEFLSYGWLHGLTVTLPVFLSGADAIAEALHGKTVLITAAESHYSGDTWILLDMLRARGVDAYFMQPTREELLIKPAYFKAYKNVDRYFGAGQAFDYVVGDQEVRFLDFQSAVDWARTKNQLPRTDHIDMEIVAKGGLAEALTRLDPSKAYVGLAYDRRTFYHSILAGEILTAGGVKWLGINTEPGLFNRAVLTDEDLIDPEEAIYALVQAKSIHAIGSVIALVPGSAAWVVFLNLAISFVGAFFAARPRHPAVQVGIALLGTAASYALWIAYLETTQVWASDDLISLSQILGALGGWFAAKRVLARRQFKADAVIEVLPSKIALLQRAAELGYRVQKGYVVSNVDLDSLPRWVASERVLVRSAAFSESSSAQTIGVFESIPAQGKAEVMAALRSVHAQIKAAGEVPFALIQTFIRGEMFGVAMFGTASDGHLFICEGGRGDAATAGTGETERVAIPVWQTAGLSRDIKKVRSALLTLHRDMGATSIEWAVSASGNLSILQVSTDTLGRPGLAKLLKGTLWSGLGASRFVALPIDHGNSVGAAVVAAMAGPGDQFSVGGVRLARVRGMVSARALQLADITSVLGSLPSSAFSRVPGSLLLKAFELACQKRDSDRRTRQISLSAPDSALAEAIACELAVVSCIYGRFGRIATTAIEMKIESPSQGFERALRSTELGHEASKLSPAEAEEMASFAGFVSVSSYAPFSTPSLDAELVSPVIQVVDSPLAWMKDKCAVMMMIELGRLSPAIDELCRRGVADLLLDILPSYLGELPINCQVFDESPKQLSEFFDDGLRNLRTGNKPIAWGIPRSGLELTLTCPATFAPGTAVFLETTDMSQLPLISTAGALVVRSGSSLSHLLQHARRLNVPHVVGLESGAELVGKTVRIEPTGEVLRA
ncbi:hypothetical protein QO021_29480 (plasmid) [Pseudomonas amygdali pv. lachrymans]|uniref:PEP-utilizing enzyme n=1 Tax=Pseudomonas amygdali TaxID=47877 RepID=UPI0006BA0C8F|nr:PEP-utilizing enzyme [Pseudomonas amygdali]KPC02154.1 putative transmembrane protein [Pseudomonas amygdali pv. lachrymans]RMM39353.1 hypothetical protein ALQ79_200284 [Pseudomonas amygdali pv. lachrymans]WIO61222.1 hypothetical protein QO021_29480 [Pseudomonas amygdali pv. lachrymans]